MKPKVAENVRSVDICQIAAHNFIDQKFSMITENGGIAHTDRSLLSQMMLGKLGVGIVISDSRGRITRVNSAAKRLAKEDPEGKRLSIAENIWGELFDPSGRHLPLKEWPCMRALRGETTVGLECFLVRADGSTCNLLFGSCPIGEAGTGIKGSFSSLTDVTKQKGKEVRLRTDAVLLERTRIAGDIHDTLVQGLNALVLQLEVLEEELRQNREQAGSTLQLLLRVARESLAESRRTMWALSQQDPQEQDPAVSLAFLAEKLFAGIPMQLHLNLQEDRRLSLEMRREVLGIAREALTNVLKHSHASVVRVDLTYAQREVRLSVRDNGRGFARLPIPANTQCGFGLLALKARAEQIGGNVTVDSRPGRGTRVLATVPLPV